MSLFMRITKRIIETLIFFFYFFRRVYQWHTWSRSKYWGHYAKINVLNWRCWSVQYLRTTLKLVGEKKEVFIFSYHYSIGFLWSCTHQFPECNKSKPSLILSNERLCVTNSSSINSFDMYCLTSLGTLSLDFQPPKAVPFHTRPVTNWKGLVLISCPAEATPTITDVPQPLWHDSKAAL